MNSTQLSFITIFSLLMAGCQPHEEVYRDYCENDPAIHYDNPVYSVSSIHITNRKQGPSSSRPITEAYDTVSFEGLYTEAKFNTWVYAYPPVDGVNTPFVDEQSLYFGCLKAPISYLDSIESLTVTTNHDIDSSFVKNDTITNIMTITEAEAYNDDSYLRYNIEDFLKNGPAPLKSQYYAIRLSRKPTATDTFSINIHMRLTNGKEIEETTKPIIFNP